jgi:hypothetical protein
MRPDIRIDTPAAPGKRRRAGAASLAYLDRLADWSRDVRAASDLTGPWLPGAIRNSLAQQWWSPTAPPQPGDVRDRIAAFWVEVVPWLAWHPEAPELPDPPGDPSLVEAICAGLDREAARSGGVANGWDRGATFRRAASRLRELHASTATKEPTIVLP